MKAMTPELKHVVLTGAMATISASTIRDNYGKPWPGDKGLFLRIEDAQHHLEDQPHVKGSALSHAIAIIAAAKVQIVAEAWGAEFPLDQAWSQSELQRLLDIEA